MTGGQVAALLIFWLAGTALAIQALSEDGESFAEAARRLGWAAPVMGAMAGIVLLVVAWATTTGDLPDRYW
jgi:hypothetical protein